MKLSKAVEFYLETRRSLGFALTQVGVQLRSLVRYAQEVGHTGPLTSSLVVDWAQQPEHARQATTPCALKSGGVSLSSG